MSEPRIELCLSIEPGSDPLSGTVSHGGGMPRPFNGWLELATAIERISTVEPTTPRSDRTARKPERARRARGG